MSFWTQWGDEAEEEVRERSGEARLGLLPGWSDAERADWSPASAENSQQRGGRNYGGHWEGLDRSGQSREGKENYYWDRIDWGGGGCKKRDWKKKFTEQKVMYFGVMIV